MRIPDPSFPAIAWALVTLAVPASAQTQASGTVFDAYTRRPLADVAVHIDTRTGQSATETPRDGSFSVSCSPGTRLVFQRFGYETYERVVESCGEFLNVGMTPSMISLNALDVVATRGGPALEHPRSIATVSRQELRRGTGLFLEDAVNLLPGITMEKRTMSGGQRFTIRGYGNTSNFTGTGYKAYLNGIPITSAEGTTVLDDVDFSTLGKVDVIRGPASSLYGTGIAGVVNMYTLRPSREGTTGTQEVIAGADGLLRTNTRLETVSGNSSMLFNYGHQNYDSYRVHSGSKKNHAVFIGDFRPSARRTISTFLAYAQSYDERAGQLDSIQFLNEMNTGEDRYIDNNAHVDLESYRAGVTHAYRFNDRVEHVVTAHASGKTAEESFAVGLTDHEDLDFGVRTTLNTAFNLDGERLTGTTGFELQKTNVQTNGYALFDQELGAQRSALATETMQSSIFSQWELELASDLTLSAGGSVNFVEYTIDDRQANSSNPTHQDASGTRNFDPVFTPSAAINKVFNDQISAYASLSQGYSPPTSGSVVIPYTGEVNDALEPERATQLEIGSKGDLFGQRLSYQLALFDLKVKDKHTSQTVFDTEGNSLYSYTVNAGDQDNRGVEIAAGLGLVNSPRGAVSLVRPFFTYAYSDFTYEDFKSDNDDNAETVDYTGNAVVGVPTHALSLGVDVETRSGPYLNATWRYSGDVPLTYDNVHEAPSYSVFNAKAGTTHSFEGGLSLDVFVGAENLTGNRYYTMVFLNGSYAGGSVPHIYLPGPWEAQLHGGLTLRYGF